MTETPSNSHDDAASPRFPTQAIANEGTGLCLPSRCSASGLCSALLPRTRFHVSTIASFLDGRPPYKSNFYCHPGRAGGTPMLLANLFDLSGRVAVVTGGNGGIGRRVLHGLAQAGGGLPVLWPHQGKNQRVLGGVKARGGRGDALRGGGK